MWSFIGSFLGSIAGVLITSMFGKRLEVRINKAKAVVQDLLTNEKNKTEFLYPMNEEESDEYEKSLTSQGELEEFIKSKFPWNTPKTNQSSDLSDKKE